MLVSDEHVRGRDELAYIRGSETRWRGGEVPDDAGAVGPRPPGEREQLGKGHLHLQDDNVLLIEASVDVAGADHAVGAARDRDGVLTALFDRNERAAARLGPGRHGSRRNAVPVKVGESRAPELVVPNPARHRDDKAAAGGRSRGRDRLVRTLAPKKSS